MFTRQAGSGVGYLGVRCEEIDDAEDGNERNTDDPHERQFPWRHRLQEPRLRSVPHARQMLLTVRMRHELISQTTSTRLAITVCSVPL